MLFICMFSFFDLFFNPLPNDKILNVTKLKAFEDDKRWYNDDFSTR